MLEARLSSLQGNLPGKRVAGLPLLHQVLFQPQMAKAFSLRVRPGPLGWAIALPLAVDERDYLFFWYGRADIKVSGYPYVRHHMVHVVPVHLGTVEYRFDMPAAIRILMPEVPQPFPPACVHGASVGGFNWGERLLDAGVTFQIPLFDKPVS